jgi:hypothetical protein
MNTQREKGRDIIYWLKTEQIQTIGDLKKLFMAQSAETFDFSRVNFIKHDWLVQQDFHMCLMWGFIRPRKAHDNEGMRNPREGDES